MINAVLCLSILGLSFHSSLSKVTSNSTCPIVPTFKHLDVFKFKGSWFVHGMFPSLLHEVPDGKTLCGIITYSVDHRSKMNIVEETFHAESNTKEVADFQGFIPDLSDASKWELGRPDGPSTGDYWILDTDYVNYAVPLLCRSVNNQRSVAAWVLTRERSPSKIAVNKAFQAAYQYGFTESDFSLFNQALC